MPRKTKPVLAPVTEIVEVPEPQKTVKIYPPNGQRMVFAEDVHTCICGNEKLMARARYCQECGARIVGVERGGE